MQTDTTNQESSIDKDKFMLRYHKKIVRDYKKSNGGRLEGKWNPDLKNIARKTGFYAVILMLFACIASTAGFFIEGLNFAFLLFIVFMPLAIIWAIFYSLFNIKHNPIEISFNDTSLLIRHSKNIFESNWENISGIRFIDSMSNIYLRSNQGHKVQFTTAGLPKNQMKVLRSLVELKTNENPQAKDAGENEYADPMSKINRIIIMLRKWVALLTVVTIGFYILFVFIKG